MDNLFEILIYAIIIISFLSSFFKKKEPQKQKPATKTRQVDSEPVKTYDYSSGQAGTSQGKDEYDILKELENLFKGEVKFPPQQKTPSKRQEEYEENQIENVNLETISDKRTSRNIEEAAPVEYRTSVEDRNYLERKGNIEDRTSVEEKKWTRRKIYIDPALNAKADQFERVLAGPLIQRTKISEFNRKLKKPQNIREYILFSEILGKPKALRR